MSVYYGQVGSSIVRLGPVQANFPAGIPLGPTQVPTDLKPGDSMWMFGIVPAANAGGADDKLILGEQPAVPAAGVASIPACITSPVQGGPPPMVTFEFSFYATGTLVPAAPGAFEIDIQEADTDADAFYIQPTNAAYKVTAVNATTQKARVDLSPTGGKFIRVLLLTRTNAVDFVAKVTRLA
jgi:hypothetical protein